MGVIKLPEGEKWPPPRRQRRRRRELRLDPSGELPILSGTTYQCNVCNLTCDKLRSLQDHHQGFHSGFHLCPNYNSGCALVSFLLYYKTVKHEWWSLIFSISKGKNCTHTKETTIPLRGPEWSSLKINTKLLNLMNVRRLICSYKFEFPGPDDRPGAPIIIFSDASFAYPGGSTLFRNLNFGIDLDSRVAMVGPNGIGKSTILKLISGELQPSSGTVFRSAKGMPEQKLRGHLGSFGITGNLALQPMHTMSGGQKSRVAFSKITFKKPHILLLDESSNHIDLDAVEALIQGLVLFQGGVLMATSSAVMQTAGVDTTEKQLSTGKNVQDSELMAAFKDPEVMAALQDGIARQRQAIVEGIRDSVIAFCRNVPGIPAKDVVDMVLVTQYFDTIREIGATSKSSAVFIPHERICDGLLQALVMV